MEAAFNSDYDRLLIVLERHSNQLSVIAYNAIFDLINSEEDEDNLDSKIQSILAALISDIYKAVHSLYSDWYVSAFGFLSSVGTAQLNAILEGSINSAITDRITDIVPKISETIKEIPKESISTDKLAKEVSKKLSERLSVTEVGGAAGTSISATATALFPTSELYKRWISVGDERVRATHLDASRRKPIRESQLYRVGNSFMRFPVDPKAFGGNVAAEVIRCRCRSLVLPLTNGNALNAFLLRP